MVNNVDYGRIFARYVRTSNCRYCCCIVVTFEHGFSTFRQQISKLQRVHSQKVPGRFAKRRESVGVCRFVSFRRSLSFTFFSTLQLSDAFVDKIVTYESAAYAKLATEYAADIFSGSCVFTGSAGIAYLFYLKSKVDANGSVGSLIVSRLPDRDIEYATE